MMFICPRYVIVGTPNEKNDSLRVSTVNVEFQFSIFSKNELYYFDRGNLNF